MSHQSTGITEWCFYQSFGKGCFDCPGSSRAALSLLWQVPLAPVSLCAGSSSTRGSSCISWRRIKTHQGLPSNRADMLSPRCPVKPGCGNELGDAAAWPIQACHTPKRPDSHPQGISLAKILPTELFPM